MNVRWAGFHDGESLIQIEEHEQVEELTVGLTEEGRLNSLGWNWLHVRPHRYRTAFLLEYEGEGVGLVHAWITGYEKYSEVVSIEKILVIPDPQQRYDLEEAFYSLVLACAQWGFEGNVIGVRACVPDEYMEVAQRACKIFDLPGDFNPSLRS